MSVAKITNKPNIAILATGGTIAGSADSNTDMTGYAAGSLDIKILIEAVPEIKQYANVSGQQITNISSSAMTNDIWLKLAEKTNTLLKQSTIDGVVITHGTDTMEETAYFLNLVVKSNKPVVLVGSMRPATGISADGPVNLLNAVCLAGSEEAIGKGVLVILNEQINAARDVTKTNTTHVETFKAHELGYLGYMQNFKPYFYRLSSRKHTVDTEFDITDCKSFPRVDIVFGHVNGDSVFVEAAIAAGAKGIIYASMGHGSIHPDTQTGLIKARKAGVIIVKSSRVGNGIVTRLASDDKDDFVAGDTLIPQKARILLMLALTKTNDSKEIQRMFDTY